MFRFLKRYHGETLSEKTALCPLGTQMLRFNGIFRTLREFSLRGCRAHTCTNVSQVGELSCLFRSAMESAQTVQFLNCFKVELLVKKEIRLFFFFNLPLEYSEIQLKSI